jgi:hypothetical protein
MSTNNDIVEDLKSDPEINGLIEEEKALIATGNANDETLEDVHIQTVEHIEDALEKDPKGSIQKVQGLVQNKLKEYGGFDKTVEMLKNTDVSKIPRFIQKMLRSNLPLVINYLKDKQMNPEWIAAIDGLLGKIRQNLIDTKKPGFFSNLFGKKTGGQKGGEGEAFLFMIGWIAFLIACCATGIGCFVCGPLLVITFCGMLGQAGLQLCGSFAQAATVGPKSGSGPKQNDNQKGGRSQRQRRSQRHRRSRRRQRRSQLHKRSQTRS